MHIRAAVVEAADVTTKAGPGHSVRYFFGLQRSLWKAGMTKTDREETYVVRTLPQDLESVLANMPRTNERTKEWMREFFVEGKSTVEIARAYGVEPQHVGSKVRAVRAKLAEQSSPMTYVQLRLSLPLALGQELQALVNELGTRGSLEVAQTALQPVLQAVTMARKKLEEGHQ